MKTYIWCKLFGHKFCHRTWEYGHYQKVPTDFCVNCGIPRKESPNECSPDSVGSSGTYGGNGILSKTNENEK